MVMKNMLTALAGQPNCGKSTIFNMLTGARQYVANYPGVTVEKKSGVFTQDGIRVTLVDLPGTYSLASWSPEEQAARQFILEEKPDLIISVLDASTLEKSLYLCLQVLETGRPVLAAMNMLDVAAKRRIDVDAGALSASLGVPVVPVQASKGIGRQALREAIAGQKGVTVTEPPVNYRDLESSIARIVALLPAEGVEGYPARWLAIKLLEEDAAASAVLPRLAEADAVERAAREEREDYLETHGEDPVRAIANARFARAREVAAIVGRL